MVTELDMKLRPLFMLTCSVADLWNDRRVGGGRRHMVNPSFNVRSNMLWRSSLTFPPFPGQELGTEGRCLSPLKVFSLWKQNEQERVSLRLTENAEKVTERKRKRGKKVDLSFLQESWNRFKPQNILFVIKFLDFLSLWKMKWMREGCGAFGLADWVSEVSEDGAGRWWDPHSSSDIWEVLSV